MSVVQVFACKQLEVYNWGTFNRQVWVIEPGGNTALLTGANGSGKSTLVDALLTLLVPNTHRNYNQASGAERRRERDEKSYVRGAYGRIKDEEFIAGSCSIYVAKRAMPRYWRTFAMSDWVKNSVLRIFSTGAMLS